MAVIQSSYLICYMTFYEISLWEIFQYSLRGQSNRDKIAKNLIYSFEKPKKKLCTIVFFKQQNNK